MEKPPPPGIVSEPAVVGIPVVSNPQPLGVQAPEPLPPGYWSTGLCDCFSDVKSCCLVCWCPCIAFGRLSQIVDKGTTSCCCNGSLYMLLCSLGTLGTALGVPLGFQWVYSCTYRGKLKHNLNIVPPSCCEECCLHFWCEPCAMCQEYRELQIRGYDLSLGWNENVEKRATATPPVMVAPPVAPSMAR